MSFGLVNLWNLYCRMFFNPHCLKSINIFMLQISEEYQVVNVSLKADSWRTEVSWWQIKFELLSSLNNCVSINGHAVDGLVLYLGKNLGSPNFIGHLRDLSMSFSPAQLLALWFSYFLECISQGKSFCYTGNQTSSTKFIKICSMPRQLLWISFYMLRIDGEYWFKLKHTFATI